jgi:hypothetical protein
LADELESAPNTPDRSTGSDKPKSTAIYPYAFVIFLATVWLWNTKWESFSLNAGEAVGYNLVALGLPVGLLWFGVNKMRRGLKQREINAPYKLIFGSIFISCSLAALFDLVGPTDPHKLGATICILFFGVIAAVLFGLAYRQRRNASDCASS